MKEQYVVTLRGANVWHECILVCIIDNVDDSMLNTVASYIQTQFDVQVDDFKFDFWKLVCNHISKRCQSFYRKDYCSK